MTYDALIIGAGASGLMAMNELEQTGYNVCLLEATDKAGGRIATEINSFGEAIETGAEFIHGKTSLTAKLLKDASIPYERVTGKMIPVRNGVWFEENISETDYEVFEKRLEALENDCTIAEFLENFLPPGEYDEVRTAVRQFAEGFSLANVDNASVFAFRKEWKHQQDEQYRIPGGYSRLVDHLLQGCVETNSHIHYSSPVQKVEHRPGSVTVYTKDGQFAAKKLIVTVSAGVMQSGSIQFVPELTTHNPCFKKLGFGSVVKILFRFKNAFWKEHDDDIGFLLSDERIPTWWTQHPAATPVLTGWVGGPTAINFGKLDETLQKEKALSSLASIFHRDISFLRDQLQDTHIICWHNNPYTHGGYSYLTLDSAGAKKVLAQPVNDTIYFAGEAMYQGDLQGTVEAALMSGKQVASQITNGKK